MTDENTSENDKSSGNNKVAETINAVTGLTQSVPVYQDLIQPAAQELGKGLAVIAKSINVALSPLSVMVWGYEKIQDQFMPKVAEKLKNTKPEDIITPKPNVAVPAIEALRYTADDESLSDLFAGLLSSAMDKNKAETAHPAFVEIIKQLTSDEAKIVSIFLPPRPIPLVDVQIVKKDVLGFTPYFSNYSLIHEDVNLEHPELLPTYINNLCRLGLSKVPDDGSKYIDEKIYLPIENSPFIKKLIAKPAVDGKSFSIKHKVFMITELGHQFYRACVK
ncbi:MULTISPECIES: DUF4393 domain-containing protein [Pectobacterium]|uniref:DUF4393 domain-containing protein n=1 Tax=Pectobacterium carotovorum subsp. carotovorum (strain PC1) TaxID=561230 RepID=C6D9C6_PECCP|nr:DUF4393 domain-containing protein [Pectobacterium carotovorum]ACT13653.1 conserved hypothetical protein [Pectobacterium carotovorum subsp. carotovorum PC1]